MLQRRDERQLDALPQLIGGLRIRIRLDVELAFDRRGQLADLAHRRVVVERDQAFRPLLDQLEAGVRGDPVQPGTHRTASLEPRQPPPGADERLLQGVLGVVHRAKHAVAVRVQLAAVRRDEPVERALVVAAGGFEQVGFNTVHPRHPARSRGASFVR